MKYRSFALLLFFALPVRAGSLTIASNAGVDFQIIECATAADFRIEFKAIPDQGVWGIAFRVVDPDHYCLMNFYPEKRLVYYYRNVKGSFIEVRKENYTPEENPITIEATGNRIFLQTSGGRLEFEEPYFRAGAIALRTETTALSLNVIDCQVQSSPSRGDSLFDEEAFLNDYLPKMESTMLFHDFSQKPDDLHFLQVRGETACDWREGTLEISFPRQLDAWMTFHKDISGYEGLRLEGSFSQPGAIRVEMTDILGRVFHRESRMEAEASAMEIPFAEMKNENSSRLLSLETLRVRFVPDEAQERSAWRVRKIEPYGGDPMRGPWSAVDPLFAYYQFSPWPRTARAMKNFGFRGAEIIIIKDTPGIEEQQKIVEAFHREGLMCILRLYPTTDFDAFHRHPDWRQITLDGSSQHDWRVYLCPNSDGFTEHIRAKTAEIVKAVPYDAIELSEPWFEIWGGPYPENPQQGKYACLCDNCRAKFKALSGTDPRELFDPQGERWFLKEANRALYEQWMDFRVDTILDFSKKLFDAARSVRPGVKIVHMHLSDCTVEPGRIREYQAQDFEKAIQVINPDAMIIEDAWQDWVKPETRPDFIRAYGAYYLKPIRKLSATIKVFGHADIGSLAPMQRSYSWMREFSAHAHEAGFDGVDYYEFTTGDFSR